MDVEDVREQAERLEAQGMWGPEALSLYEQLLTSDPDDQGARLCAGRCLEALGRFDEAGEQLRQVSPGTPHADIASRRLGRIKERSQAQATAFDWYDDGTDALRQAAAQAKSKWFIVEAQRLLADHETDVPSLVQLGAAQRDAGDFDGSLLSFESALALDPSPATNAPSYTGRAALLRRLGRLPEAEASVRSVLECRPRDRYASQTLAAVLMDRAEKERSCAPLREARVLLGALSEVLPIVKRLAALEEELGC